jgi:hypothetical protein
MTTNDPVPAPLPPATTGSSPVLAYASRGDQSRVIWIVCEAIVLAVVAVIAAPMLLDLATPHRSARESSLITSVQSLRYHVAQFKLEHNERLPGVCPLVENGGPSSAEEATFWAQMTQFTDLDGNTRSTKSDRYCYGPYLKSVWANPLNGSTTIASAPAPGVGFVYDFAGGAGSGKVWGVDLSGSLIRQ